MNKKNAISLCEDLNININLLKRRTSILLTIHINIIIIIIIIIIHAAGHAFENLTTWRCHFGVESSAAVWIASDQLECSSSMFGDWRTLHPFHAIGISSNAVDIWMTKYHLTRIKYFGLDRVGHMTTTTTAAPVCCVDHLQQTIIINMTDYE
jgi:hypothetical protein